MTHPLVTFVVPVYNYGRYVGDCLHSILDLEGGFPFEVIVVDDASTDNSAEVLHSFDDPRIRLLRNEKNLGHARTIEIGLSHAVGRFVARIDPDDRYRSHFLTKTLPEFDDPDVILIYGDAALIDENGQVTAERSDVVHRGMDFKGNEFVLLLEENFICAPTVIARREGWLKALPVPSHLAFNDWYFTLTMARSGLFRYLNEVLAEYRVHPANHHMMVVAQRDEEPSICWLLDRVFQEREDDPVIEEAKRVARRAIYAAHYLSLAPKYFGLGMYGDARRCYVLALRFQPKHIWNFSLWRHVLATIIGQRAYEAAKRVIRGSRPTATRL